jgi:hypothetical protein
MSSAVIFSGLVTGHAGHGKTTLLWSIAQHLPEPWEAWFFQAATLQGDLRLLDRLGFRGGHPDLVRAIAIDAALRSKRPLVLMDTVDLLLHREEDAAVLEALITAARDCGCALLMSSRPAEAERFRESDVTQFVLHAYSESEFARAVRRHSEYFCPGLVRDEEEHRVERLLDAVARGEPIREIVLSPLTLRMLFEVYAPEDISHADINVIALYRRYWDMRVADDRRGSGTQLAPSRDLSILAEEIALVMVEEGTTVLNETHIDHAVAAAGAVDGDQHILIERGVVQPSGDRKYTFFHQSFFEFAAGLALYRRLGVAAIGEFQGLLTASPDDLLRLPVLEQLLVLCSAGSVEDRLVAASEMSRLLASPSLAERRAAVYVFALWQQGEPESFDPASIAKDHVLVIRRFYGLAGNIYAHRIDAVFVVLEALWHLPSVPHDPVGRENWRKKENSFGLLQRLALRAPNRLRQFVDHNPVLADAAAHIAGDIDVADIIRALVVLARIEPDWSFDKLVWLYEEALRRYGKRDTQRKILMLVAENPDSFPTGYRLASKIAAQTTRRFEIPIDGERLVLCRALACNPPGAATGRLEQHVRELLGGWDGDPDWIKRFADGLHDCSMPDPILRRLLDHPHLQSPDAWMTKPYHILVPAALSMGHPGAEAALRTPETLPSAVLKSLCQCFRNAEDLAPVAVAMAFRLYFADHDLKAIAALSEKLAKRAVSVDVQHWSAAMNQLTATLLGEANPVRRIFGYRILRASVRLTLRSQLSATDLLAWVRRECRYHSLLCVLDLGGSLGDCSAAAFHGCTGTTARMDAGDRARRRRPVYL